MVQDAFGDPDDRDVVSFYTTCLGENIFLETLLTANLQARAARELLESVNADTFAMICPNEVIPPPMQ